MIENAICLCPAHHRKGHYGVNAIGAIALIRSIMARDAEIKIEAA